MNPNAQSYRLRIRAIISLFIFLSAVFAHAAVQNAARTADSHREQVKNVFWQPDQPQQGSPLFITCELNGSATRVTGAWQGKNLSFFRSEKPRLWYALAGIDLNTNPGSYDLKISALMRTGHWASSVRSITIAPGNFGEGNVQVAVQYVEPNPPEQKQIDRDGLLKKRAFARDIRLPLWSGEFGEPVEAPSTPSFGETHLMNEEKISRHLGTDYPAKEGTPVRASNSGVVVLARSLFYEGNCVIINHGQRFFTVYMHLSRIDVREGSRVRKEQAIGLSGATGRVTGPHLHFEALWAGTAVDPVQLLHLTLPAQTPARRGRARQISQTR